MVYLSPNFEYKVRWQREETGNCVPYMYEPCPNSPKLGNWVRYNRSKAYKVDSGIMICSEGMRSFQNSLKLGYKLEKTLN